jgi:lipopolysaccharide transport system ATP-binding protein
MSHPAISVEGLSKRYVIGSRQPGHRTLREAICDSFAEAFRRARGAVGAREGRRAFWALKDVNFSVDPGDVVGIVGRNGAGKSTLLKVLSRITEPTSGQAHIRGRVGSLLEVGTGFHSELTGRENVYLNGAIMGMSTKEIRRKFDEIAAFAEVDGFLDTPVKRYSTGMYLRLAFSVAAHLDPEILIVDEVLTVGDAAFQARCLGKMGTVARSGRTVLFVSHNMTAVRQLCNCGLILDRGQLVHFSRDTNLIVSKYLLSSQSGDWDAVWMESEENEFGNAWFTPRRFAIVDEMGEAISGTAARDRDLWIQIEGEVHQLDPALTVGYCVYGDDGTLLYESYHTDGPVERWPKLMKGTNVLRARLPKRLLNQGTYRFELLGAVYHREWLLARGGRSPSISLTIEGGLSDSPYWVVRRPGLMAPVIEWS